jgi:hypothetical protein
MIFTCTINSNSKSNNSSKTKKKKSSVDMKKKHNLLLDLDERFLTTITRRLLSTEKGVILAMLLFRSLAQSKLNEGSILLTLNPHFHFRKPN